MIQIIKTPPAELRSAEATISIIDDTITENGKTFDLSGTPKKIGPCSAENWAADIKKLFFMPSAKLIGDGTMMWDYPKVIKLIRAIQADAIASIRGVPVEPTEEMYSGLARDIVIFLTMEGPHYGSKLHRHLDCLGNDIPAWLDAEIPNKDHTPPMATFALCIYKAMLAPAPPIPKTEGKS